MRGSKEAMRNLFFIALFSALALVFSTKALAIENEAALRQKLGVPAEAKSVLVFAQSSHVDPDWLLKADQYQRATDKAFDGALVELKKDPRYVYSVECIFFFKRYWDGHPESRDLIRNYVNQGRLRFSGTGITTPDTLLPEGENLLRDFLVGLTWLTKNGMNVNPRIAYFPDDFGHSPSVPSLLRGLGLQFTAVSRIDGLNFPGGDYRPASAYPFKGSSAELLFKKYQTLDFVWRAGDGAEVLTHVNAFTYGQGDLIAFYGQFSLGGFYLGLPARSPRQTNAKIDSYIEKLRPLSKTGYMFCPVGSDFNPPVPDLNRILDRYNQDRYPQTGVFAVLATLEDYMDLISFHQDQLPVLALDPNPYWTGFYASRPELKQRCRGLSRSLVLAEALGILAEGQGHAGAYPDLAWPWEISLMSDHHDFITGTARDTVVNEEQIPWLMKAQSQVDQALHSLTTQLVLPAPPAAPSPVTWKLEGDRLKVENRFYAVELDGKQGGCITSWQYPLLGRQVLAGPSNDVAIYRENGGLYSIGPELAKGYFRETASACGHPAKISAEEKDGVLVVTVNMELMGRPLVRELFFRGDQPMVRMRLRGQARRGETVTVRFRPALKPGRFIQEVPYGVVERPLQKIYTPTFWAVKNWVDLLDTSENFGVNLALAAPAAVNAGPDGSLQAIALRYAPAEKVMGITTPVGLLANGTDPGVHDFDYAFWPHGPEPWLERQVYNQAGLALSDSFIAPGPPDLSALAFAQIKLDRPDVIVTAIKKSETGDFLVVRLFRYSPSPVTVRLSWPGRKIQQALRADALERTQDELPLPGGQVELTMPFAIATVLLRLAPP